jgi:hypothetical protein
MKEASMETRRLLTANWLSLTPRQQVAAIEAAKIAGRRETGRNMEQSYLSPLEQLRAYDLFVATAYGRAAAEVWIDDNNITGPSDDPRVYYFCRAAFSRQRRRARVT